jgi:hypothetical protein
MVNVDEKLTWNDRLCPMLNGTWPGGMHPSNDTTAVTPAEGSELPTPGGERPAPRLSTSFQF